MMCSFSIVINGFAPWCFAGDSFAIVKRTAGVVSIRIGHAPSWKNCATGNRLTGNDAIRTMKKADCDIILPDSSVLRMDEKTTLEFLALKTFGVGVLTTKIKLTSGTAIVQIRKQLSLESVCELELSTATVLVYSGVIGFDVSDEQSVVKVYSGKAVVTPSGSAAGVAMTDNQKTAVAKGQMRVLVENVDKKEADNVLADTIRINTSTVLDTQENCR
jgi:hypothetical protein